MRAGEFFPFLAVMALVTYLVRALPFATVNKKIKNRFIRSFLYYVPYAVLGVMTVPDIFFATGSPVTGLAALVTAAAFSYREKGLLTVALFSCLSAFLTQLLISAL